MESNAEAGKNQYNKITSGIEKSYAPIPLLYQKSR